MENNPFKLISLEEIADKIIENDYNETSVQIKNVMREILVGEIKNKVIEKEKERILEETKKEIQEYKAIEKIKKVKILVLEAIFLGLTVGLLGNQITELLSYTKISGAIDNRIWILTSIFTILLGAAIYLFYQTKVIESILEYFNKERNNGNNL